jgi:hypothetical protein
MINADGFNLVIRMYTNVPAQGIEINWANLDPTATFDIHVVESLQLCIKTCFVVVS